MAEEKRMKRCKRRIWAALFQVSLALVLRSLEQFPAYVSQRGLMRPKVPFLRLQRVRLELRLGLALLATGRREAFLSVKQDDRLNRCCFQRLRESHRLRTLTR